MSRVLIGHVSADTNGVAVGGGSGKELKIRPWFNKSWKEVYIPTSEETANAMVEAMKKACANKNIYGCAKEEATLFDEAAKVDWDLSKIDIPCGTDNTTLITVCANAVGTYVPKGRNVEWVCTFLVRNGQFRASASKTYLNASNKLKKGTVIVSDTMMAVVMNDGPEVDKVKTAKEIAFEAMSVNTMMLGLETTYANIVAKKVDVYNGPGEKFKTIDKLSKGETVGILDTLADDWFKIVYPKLQAGYAYIHCDGTNFTIENENIIPVETTKKVDYNVYIAGAGLNVRTGPGKEYPVAGRILNRQPYTIIKEKAGWGYLATGMGWIDLKKVNKI